VCLICFQRGTLLSFPNPTTISLIFVSLSIQEKNSSKLQIHVLPCCFKLTLLNVFYVKLLLFKRFGTLLVQSVYLVRRLIVLNTSGHFNFHGKFLQIHHTSSCLVFLSHLGLIIILSQVHWRLVDNITPLPW